MALLGCDKGVIKLTFAYSTFSCAAILTSLLHSERKCGYWYYFRAEHLGGPKITEGPKHCGERK